MLGKTNATTGGSSGGGAAVGGEIEVINKTGANIAIDDKVWLNENAQTAGTSFTVAFEQSTSTYGVMTGSGKQVWVKNKLYSLSGDTYTYIGDYSITSFRAIKYAAGSSVFALGTSSTAAYRIDEGGTYTASGYPIGEDFFYSTSVSTGQLRQLNMETGEIIKSWDWGISPSTSIIKVGNYLYLLSTSAKNYYRIDGDVVTSLGSYSGSNFGSDSIYPLGVTADNKYIVCGCKQPQTFYDVNSISQLRLIEIQNTTTLKMLSQPEMPADLQTFYNSAYITFNPATGVMCLSKRDQTYAVVRYENGTWNSLPVDLSSFFTSTSYSFYHAGFTISDDLTRVCLGSAKGVKAPNYGNVYVINLEATNGYVAVPYRTYNINNKTLTGVAKTDASVGEVLTAIIGGDVTEVYNQDKTITENGTYTADVGYTGLGTVTVNVKGGGDTVTAVNKTGAVINEGDKVWLQKDAQIDDNYYFLDKGVSNRTEFFITRTGDYAFSGHKGFYKVDNGFSQTKIFTQQYSYCLRYMDNGTTFVTRNLFSGGQSARVDDNLVSDCSTYIPICKNYFLKNNINWYLHKLNLDTFAEEGGWYFENNALKGTNVFIIDDRLYYDDKMFRLPEGGGTIPSGTTGESVKGLPNTWTQNVCGTTSDGKFVIFCSSNDLVTTGTLKIYEAVNDTTFRYVELRELPPEFEYFYNKNTCYAIFNPYTGILTCTINNTRRYLIAQYVDGVWKVLQVKISVDNTDETNPVTNLRGALTVSDDLNRIAAIRVNVNNGNCYLVYDTKAVSGYSALSYKVYNLDSTTLTGKAKTSAEIGAEVEVSTVLSNEVDVTVTASEDDVTLSME